MCVPLDGCLILPKIRGLYHTHFWMKVNKRLKQRLLPTSRTYRVSLSKIRITSAVEITTILVDLSHCLFIYVYTILNIVTYNSLNLPQVFPSQILPSEPNIKYIKVSVDRELRCLVIFVVKYKPCDKIFCPLRSSSSEP